MKCFSLTNSSLQSVSRLPLLTELIISYCNNVTDSGLMHLSGLTNLNKLHCECLDKVSLFGIYFVGIGDSTSLQTSSSTCQGFQTRPQKLKGLKRLVMCAIVNDFYDA